MSDPKPRQTLKLKVSNPAAPAAEPKPAAPKLKLKIGPSAAAAVHNAPEAPAPSPKIRLTKPKKDKPARISTGTKRGRDALDDDAGGAAPATAAAGGVKKLKLTSKGRTPTTPYVKFKSKGRPPPRPPGVGYDSEASDREVDPAIEEEFILRMQPGDDCEYLRAAVEQRRWGKPGAEVRLKFLQSDGRRAVLVIRGRIYAAALVDMPCIVEGTKSWDRKTWYKAADICQMLLVLGVVQTEAEALNYPLPEADVDKVTWAYAHGLTPPLRWVRKQRFRKRISAHTIEEIEAEVDRLFRMDAESVDGQIQYELIDPRRLNEKPAEQSGQAGTEEEEEEFDEDDGDMGMDGYFGQGEEVEQEVPEVEAEAVFEDDDMAADFEAALEGDEAGPTEAVVELPSAAEVPTPVAAALEHATATESEEASTPAAGVESKEDSGDDEDSGDEDEDVDEDELEQRADRQRQHEEIADLENAIRAQRAELERVKNDILKRKLLAKIQSLEGDLELKRSALGEDGEAD